MISFILGLGISMIIFSPSASIPEPSLSPASVLPEAGSEKESQNPDWWLNSGGKLFIRNYFMSTIQGELPAEDPWRKLYAHSNPVDTDNGYHPQNLFRLIGINNFTNSSQQVYFRVIKDNLSPSPNRGAFSGIFLLSRYQDDNNGYYAGLRSDGAAVIEKKFRGTYTTLAYKHIYPGVFNLRTNPDLLPHTVWIGLKAEVETASTDSARIRLYLDLDSTSVWQLILDVTDQSVSDVLASGSGGIRSDFMDLEFQNYLILSPDRSK